MRGYFDEWFYWMAIFFAFFLMYKGFSPLFKIVMAKVPLTGLREAAAAS